MGLSLVGDPERRTALRDDLTDRKSNRATYAMLQHEGKSGREKI